MEADSLHTKTGNLQKKENIKNRLGLNILSNRDLTELDGLERNFSYPKFWRYECDLINNLHESVYIFFKRPHRKT